MWKETEVLKKIVADAACISHDTGPLHLQEKDSSASLRSVFIEKTNTFSFFPCIFFFVVL